MFPEHRLQLALAGVLAERLDPATTWWTSVDGSWAPTPWIGQLRRLRGCKSGAPDLLVLHRGKLIAFELKTRRGRLSDCQRQQRAELLAAGARWFLCRSIPAVLRALRLARMPLRRVERDPHAFDPNNLDHHPQPDPAVPRRRRAKPRKLVGLAFYRAAIAAETAELRAALAARPGRP